MDEKIQRKYAAKAAPVNGLSKRWARIAAKFANKASAATLNRATGVVLVVLGAAILAVNYLK